MLVNSNPNNKWQLESKCSHGGVWGAGVIESWIPLHCGIFLELEQDNFYSLSSAVGPLEKNLKKKRL
jgi:hypothetical protein